MPHLPFPEDESLPQQVRQCLDELPTRLNVFQIMAYAPTTVCHVADLGAALLGTLNIAPAHREMVILWVARQTGAKYEWVQHLPPARAGGVTEEQIQAVYDLDRRRPCLGPAQQAALALADRIVAGVPSGRADIARLAEHFTQREIVELAVLAGYYLMLARFLVTFDVDLDPRGDALADAFTGRRDAE
ncbi:carboxymuconolactone decarboxylase family protein [Actinomadura rubrisoli]|uniref:Carboxymuconolactone decarboxylase family protein n=1 Tax=Actinomadura rubrisoli TaxID=2530368 RepID=A0A4R5CL12_9ACTN|nr:carboxymuconolactone decarboxylase family protein [Actinomadura rubrisoli]TDD98134.1 carboxymuconolactone decarboxylase family protein [Actinomadura rubrisoli]